MLHFATKKSDLFLFAIQKNRVIYSLPRSAVIVLTIPDLISFEFGKVHLGFPHFFPFFFLYFPVMDEAPVITN